MLVTSLSFLVFSLSNYVQQKRFQNDMAVNSSPVDVLVDQKWESMPWKKLQVGDIVKVSMPHFIFFSSNSQIYMDYGRV